MWWDVFKTSFKPNFNVIVAMLVIASLVGSSVAIALSVQHWRESFQQLQDLKEERKRLENDLQKSREEKLNEIEKIDRALEKKKEKKIDKKSISTVSLVTQAAANLGELNDVLDRFIY